MVHLISMAFLLYSPSLFHKEDIKPYKVTWIRLSKGDGGTNPESNFKKAKGLPSSTVREQKSLEKIAKDFEGMDLQSKQALTKKLYQQKISQKKTSDDGGLNLEKKKVTKKVVTKMDDAIARIDQQLKQREVDMSAGQTKDGDTGQSPDGSDKGSNVDAALIMYSNAITRKIKNQWNVAKRDFSGDLLAEILVTIDARGNILRTIFKTASGNGSFDSSAMRAIKRATPFPAPPDSIKSEVLTEGFQIKFDPSGVTGRI
ncbi:MAG: TonB C-terminal domain-containing protein [Deltaproteobacteria bacterium]|nr:TonB C-terminal domain-containing protein [Deltaproteobacteria bacterium]